MESKTVYFEKPGSEDTGDVFHIVKQRAEELGIKTILVASTTGDTAVKAIEALKGLRLIAVGHATGFSTPNTQRFTDENRTAVESKGGIILNATHVMAGLGRAMRNKHDMYLLEDIVSDTLRVFGSGMKVACEIAMMAADAGLVRTDEEIIAIAGSSQGADTAIVLTPVNTINFFDLKVKEILCKPRF